MIKHCILCGVPVQKMIPEGDNMVRHVCPACGHIHYQNPRLIVGCIAEWSEKILLCRRAIDPRLGYWTLPAGFMENGETTAQAASRETHEEAGASVLIEAPFAMFSIAHINQVHLFYRGRLENERYFAGPESLEVGLFTADEIPWLELSFASVETCIRLYLADRSRGHFQFHDQTQADLLNEQMQKPPSGMSADGGLQLTQNSAT